MSVNSGSIWASNLTLSPSLDTVQIMLKDRVATHLEKSGSLKVIGEKSENGKSGGTLCFMWCFIVCAMMESMLTDVILK